MIGGTFANATRPPAAITWLRKRSRQPIARLAANVRPDRSTTNAVGAAGLLSACSWRSSSSTSLTSISPAILTTVPCGVSSARMFTFATVHLALNLSETTAANRRGIQLGRGGNRGYSPAVGAVESIRGAEPSFLSAKRRAGTLAARLCDKLPACFASVNSKRTRLSRDPQRRVHLGRGGHVVDQRLVGIDRCRVRELGAQRLDLVAGVDQRLLRLAEVRRQLLHLALELRDLATLLLELREQRQLLRGRFDQRFAGLREGLCGHRHQGPLSSWGNQRQTSGPRG